MDNEKLIADPRLRDIQDNRKSWQAPVVEELSMGQTEGSPTQSGSDSYPLFGS